WLASRISLVSIETIVYRAEAVPGSRPMMKEMPNSRFTRRALLTLLAAAAAPLPAATQPKLIVAIVVDQFRYDYLTRFRDNYNAGLDRLLTHGAVFTNAHYRHFPTVTAVGHSTFLTGAAPSISGIVGNEWFERESGKTVASISDDSVKLLGAEG